MKQQWERDAEALVAATGGRTKQQELLDRATAEASAQADEARAIAAARKKITEAVEELERLTGRPVNGIGISMIRSQRLGSPAADVFRQFEIELGQKPGEGWAA